MLHVDAILYFAHVGRETKRTFIIYILYRHGYNDLTRRACFAHNYAMIQTVLNLERCLSLVLEWKRPVRLHGHHFPASAFCVSHRSLDCLLPMFCGSEGSSDVVLCTSTAEVVCRGCHLACAQYTYIRMCKWMHDFKSNDVVAT